MTSAAQPPADPAPNRVAVRVIPCLDVDEGRVVKGVNFAGLRDAGDPVELARRYGREGADELTFLDVTASSGERATTYDVVARTAEEVFIPLTVGGGVREVADVDRLLRAGADKVGINTGAIARPEVIDEIARKFSRQSGKHPIGVTVPAVVSNGIVRTAANIDDSWIGTDADGLFSEHLGREVHVLNDADAAGLAEAHYGAARGTRGLVLVTTLGTGIGSAMILNGQLVPNAELGHLEIDGHDAETRAAESVREREGLSTQEWVERLQTYYSRLESLLWPDLFVVGGGISKTADTFLPLLDLRTPVVAAKLKNKAGIIGAARLAAKGN